MDWCKKLGLGLTGVLLITLTFSMGGCTVPAGGEQQSSNTGTMAILLVLFIAVFYFLVFRPQRKRQKQHRELVDALNKGDNVITAGGIYGKIESLDDESVVLKIESGSTIRIARASVIGRREEQEGSAVIQ